MSLFPTLFILKVIDYLRRMTIMTTGKTRISIFLETTITDADDTQRETVKTTGEMIGRGMKRLIRFKETQDDNETIDTVMTLSEDKVTLKRTGNVTMSQQFIESKKTESHYQHPLIRFRMETYTDRINYHYKESAADLELKMDYRTVIDGEDERTHTLKLLIKGE